MNKKNSSLKALQSPILWQAMICIGLLIIMLSSISAEVQELPDKAKPGECIQLRQSYKNSTYSNLTKIVYPIDNRLDYVGALMEDHGGEYNYTFCDTTQIGKYEYCTCTDVDGEPCVTSCASFEVTPSGLSSTIGFYAIFLVIIILIFLLGFYLENNWIMTLGSFLVIVLGFFVIINGIDVLKDTRTTWAIGLIVWAIGIYFMFLSMEEMLKEWR